MRTLLLAPRLVALALLLCIFGCERDEVDPPVEERSVSEIIQDLSRPEQPEEINTPQKYGKDSVIVENGMECIVQPYKYQPGYAEPLLLDPTANIYLSGAYTFSSLTDGSLAELGGKKDSIKLSISLSNLAGNPFVCVREPSLARVRAGIRELLEKGVNGNVPAFISHEIVKIHNESHLQASVGAKVNVPFFKLNTLFDWNKSATVNRYMVKFYQVYYSIDMDVPESPDNFWINPPPKEAFGGYSPVYCSSVKYGRLALFTFESTSTQSEIEAALNASIGGILKNGGVDVETKYKNTVNQSSMRALIVGGNSVTGVAINDFETLAKHILEGGTYSNESPAAPISYTLRFLDDNSIAKTILSSEYVSRQCEPLPPDPIVKTIQLNQMGPLCPPLVRGDRNIGNSGEITAEAELYTINDNELWAKVHYKVYEVRADHSTAEDTWRFKVYTAPQGQKIKRILSPTRSYHKYRDYDLGIDIFEPSGPVFQFLCIGDTQGEDLGDCSGPMSNVDRSKLSIKWHPIQLEIQP